MSNNLPKKALPQNTNQWLDTQLGKVPPQAVDLEKVVLGSILVDSNALPLITDIVTANDFYKEAHQRIYQACLSLSTRNEPIDILTLRNELERKGELELAGGAGYITEITLNVASTINIEAHSRIIKEKSIKRSLATIGNEMYQKAFDDTTDAFDLLDYNEQSLYDLTHTINRTKEISWAEQLQRTRQHILNVGEKGQIGIPSSYGGVNHMLGGYEPSNLYLVGARPAMGKSLFMNNEAIFQAYQGKVVVIFSLEMSYVQQDTRIFSAVTGIDHDVLRKGDLNKEQLAKLDEKIEELSYLNIHLIDVTTINTTQIKSELRKIRKLYGKEAEIIVWIDYIQLIEKSNENSKYNNISTSEAVGQISTNLKRIAKDLHVPIVALCQLSRAVETRGGDKKPTLSDLRDSGSLEQDANAVLFLYRPEYYGISKTENGQPTDGLLEVIGAKNREGILETVPLEFRPDISSIFDKGWYPDDKVTKDVGF